ncbi:MAG TPA: extracellular solute-binding protein, partial [Terriglobales bacterium]|nr:extracellular solute-binding protein [Terriglobales bacterium]
MSVLTLLLCSCDSRHPNPIKITVLDPEWSQPEVLHRVVDQTDRFTRETGIRVAHSPVPETSFGQLDLARKLFREQSSSPDLLSIDMIWPEMIQDSLLDLKPYFSTELSALDPGLVASYAPKGKVVAIPYHTQIGILAYRTDLLRKYGYSHPPRTWDELEKMAARIQAGEHAEDNKDFWGYVWQGAEAEGLTCNALEWQASQGGGQIIEDDQTISVNNPAAIRAWDRAARWVGWISPPGVVAYLEPDSMNVWKSGHAAFWRTWQWKYRLTHWDETALPDRTGYTSIPGGVAGRFGALGGTGLGVSRFSAHPQEAITLLRFLIKSELAPENTGGSDSGRTRPQLYDLPQALGLRSRSTNFGDQPAVVSRPSIATGQQYEKVTRAYMHAVHSVLTR